MRVVPTSQLTYQGRPCKNGHSGIRYLSSRGCVECLSSESKARYEESSGSWNAKNTGQTIEARRRWYDVNRPNEALRWVLQEFLKRTKQNKAGRATSSVLGYTSDELKTHIASLFLPGMTWENHGEWHIDHIKPVAKFIEEGIIDPRIVNALSNLQPLWKYDNLSKGSFLMIVFQQNPRSLKSWHN